MTRDEVFGTVARRVPYLLVSDADDGDDWVSCAAIVADPAADRARHHVRVRDRRRDGRGVVVHRGVRVPGCRRRARRFRTRPSRPRCRAPESPPCGSTSRALRPSPISARPCTEQPRRQLADELVGAHLQPFVAAVHDAFTVGERLLWGNVAAACAVAFRAVESSGADRRCRCVPARPQFMRRVRARGSTTPVASPQSSSPVARTGTGTGRAAVCGSGRRTARLCDNCSLREPTAAD